MLVLVAAVALTGGAATRADMGSGQESAQLQLLAADASAAACERKRSSVRVLISRARWPNIARHLADVARGGRYPQPWHIDRRGADRNRDQAIGHWERTTGKRYDDAEREGMDRDEAPPAVAREGGLWRGRYAHVRLVPSSENRSAGAYLGNKLEGWCDRQPFRMVVVR
jgi:hypothetical protein